MQANSLNLTNGAELNSRSEGAGAAGDIDVTTTGDIRLDSQAFINASTTEEGGGGRIQLQANSLNLTNGAGLDSRTEGMGAAGDIDVTTTEDIRLDNQASINASTTEEGRGGRIQLQANSLNLINGAELNSRSEGAGAAGDINATTTEDIRLDNQASINADTTGGEGNIILRPRDLLMRRQSLISTDAQGEATGGNITIETDNLVALENSDITANAEESFGGRVSITALGIFGTQFRNELTPESDITATSRLGPAFSGIVETEITAPDPTRGLVELPGTVVDPAEQIAQNPCRQGVDSEFTITSRGGLPPSPTDPLSSDAVEVGLVEPVVAGESGSRSAGEQGCRGAGFSSLGSWAHCPGSRMGIQRQRRSGSHCL